MLVQHGISTLLTRLANIFAALTVFLCIGLVACGGGGGGGGSTPTDGDSAGLTYVGNVNPAAITSTNATAIIDALIGGASSLEPVSNVQPQAVAQASEKGVIFSAVDALLSLRHSKFITRVVGALDYHAASVVPVQETLPCDSGFISLKGSLDDQTGVGVVTVSFNACATDGETINGAGTLTVNSIDLTFFEITDGLFNFPLLTFTSSDSDVSMSIDIHEQLSIDENLERLTLNLVGRDNKSGDMAKYENFVEENVYRPSVLSPASYTQVLRGRMFDSTDGYVDFSVPEVSLLTYAAIDQLYPDTGVLVFGGDNSNLRLVTQSSTNVQVDLDSDGDGVHETSVTLLWEEIGQPVAADIGDNDGDGMHNSWETLYGLDPDDATDALVDSDADSISNYQEYLDRTDPTALLDQLFVPPSSAAYQGNIVYRPLDPVNIYQAQTFTVGITGQLAGIELLIREFSQTADLIVDIRPTSNGVPVSDDLAILGEVVIPPSEIPSVFGTFVYAEFSSQHIQVTAGSRLAVVLKIDPSSAGGDYEWKGDTGDLYPSGAAYTRGSSTDWFAPMSDGLTVDYGFKTFVRVAQ